MIKGYTVKGQAILNFEGKDYILVDEAYVENYQDGMAVFQYGTTGEQDKDGNFEVYKIRWDYIESEDMENVADWENPIEIIKG